ncbi:glycosyltransferase, partial [bacterium]
MDLKELPLPHPSPSLQASVIIPARDERDGIEATLNCFARQRDVNGDSFNSDRFEILLLANNCSDDTAEIARQWGKENPSIALHAIEVQLFGEKASVGHARRKLMNLACQRLQSVSRTNTSKSVVQAICSTDADTHVSPFWISHTLAEFDAGARAVGGRIFLRPEASTSSKNETRRIYLLDTTYRLLAARLESILDPRPGDPGPRHFQFFGASLAICPNLYAQIGGLPRVQCLEDMALEQELRRFDHEIRHSPHVTVWTSPRSDGRVEMGLSTQLQEWGALGLEEKQWLVPSAPEIAFKGRLQRRLRSYWASQSDDSDLQ